MRASPSRGRAGYVCCVLREIFDGGTGEINLFWYFLVWYTTCFKRSFFCLFLVDYSFLRFSTVDYLRVPFISWIEKTVACFFFELLFPPGGGFLGLKFFI